MLATDEDAVVCDLAETYGIFDYHSLPSTYIATLAVGLRDDARIKLKMSQTAYPLKTMLLASAVDRLSLLVWAKTKDAEKNRNRPKSVLEELMKKSESDIVSFKDPKAFDDAWKELTEEAREWQQN